MDRGDIGGAIALLQALPSGSETSDGPVSLVADGDRGKATVTRTDRPTAA